MLERYCLIYFLNFLLISFLWHFYSVNLNLGWTVANETLNSRTPHTWPQYTRLLAIYWPRESWMFPLWNHFLLGTHLENSAQCKSYARISIAADDTRKLDKITISALLACNLPLSACLGRQACIATRQTTRQCMTPLLLLGTYLITLFVLFVYFTNINP